MLVLSLGLSPAAIGDPSSNSASYRVVESEIGGNGQFTSTSGSYSINPNRDDAGSSLGESTVGNSGSASYQANSGFNTTAQPGLMFVVNTSTVAFGTLSAGAATYRTATFDVTDATSYGYAVTIAGTTPSYGAHNFHALASDTASSAGTEQFGINTVLNSVAGVGANPFCPAAGFCNSTQVAGDSATGTYGTTRPYTIHDQWRYNSGETIASSTKSSGDTTFTITFMANISATNTPITPGAGYTGSFNLVATGTY